MNVVWHHDECMQFKAMTVTAEAGLHDDPAGDFRQNPASRRAKCDEENLVVRLKVWELATIVIAAVHGMVIPRVSESSDPGKSNL
jgi:hypothetical protein